MDRDWFQLGVPFIAGGIVFLLVAFLTGLITPSNAARSRVEMARVDERALICQTAALATLTDDQKAALKTPDARSLRDDLASKFLIPTGDAQTDRNAHKACADKLAA